MWIGGYPESRLSKPVSTLNNLGAIGGAMYQKVDYQERECAYCKTLFKPKSKRTEYCKRSCQPAYRKKSQVSRWHTKKEHGPYTCKGCGEEYYTKCGGGEGITYCSRECSNKHPYIRKISCRLPLYCMVQTYHCEDCNKPMLLGRRLKRCIECTKKRAIEVSYKSDKAKSRKAPTIGCSVCGVMFSRLYGNKKRVCSFDCEKENKRKHRRKNSSNHRQRARHYGVRYEPVNMIKVFERDNWTCQLCGSPTPKELRGTIEDNAPELDHADPLSRGGSHSYNNTQCVCRACNIFKGTMTNIEYHQWNQSHSGAPKIGTA